MKFKNKRTGEIINLDNTNFVVSSRNKNIVCSIQGTTINHVYNSLSEFVEEWEDYEEPKEYWYITDFGFVFNHEINNKSVKSTIEEMKSIGNYFETKEEAEKAVEKLKALANLRKRGLKFNGWGLLEYGGCDRFDYSPQIGFSIPNLDKDEPYEYPEEIEKDLDICFGGEE